MSWSDSEKLDHLMRLPWTVVPQEGDEPGDLVLTCAELPSVIGTGTSEWDVTESFWSSLRLTLRAFVNDGECPPLPKHSIRGVPWESDSSEGTAARIRAVMTAPGETQAAPEAPRLTTGNETAQVEPLCRDLAAV